MILETCNILLTNRKHKQENRG